MESIPGENGDGDRGHFAVRGGADALGEKQLKLSERDISFCPFKKYLNWPVL